MIKLITPLKHRFNKQILLGGKNIFVDSEGGIEVEESLVTTALESGFELVDKNVKFTSKEEAAKIEEVQNVLNSAKETAKEIIAEAEKEAVKIIAEAQKRAESIIIENNTEEQEEFKKKLEGRSVKDLVEILVSTDAFTEEDCKEMKKKDLIGAIMKAKFSKE